MSKFIIGKIYNIRARLRRENFANFAEYYHNQSLESDHFYKILDKTVSDHKLTVSDADNIPFHSPITDEGFYFKSDNPKCKNLIGKPCLLGDILDNDVIMKVRVRPYNFVGSDGKHVGVSITLLEAQAKHSS